MNNIQSARQTILIDGREALPLRAIPDVTSWRESPDSIVRTLAAPKTRKFGNGLEVRLRHNDLFAYQMDAQGNFAQVPPSQWESWVVTLDSLTKKSKADERKGAEGENHAPWRIEAVLKLPDNVFFWLDEFQVWYSRTRPMLVDLESAEVEHATPEDAEDEDAGRYEKEDDSLCLTPILPAEIENKLWRYAKGFAVAAPTDTRATAMAVIAKVKAVGMVPNSLSDFPDAGAPAPDTYTLFFSTGKLSEKSPNWFKWKNKPAVELWQACALAFNVDPDAVITKRHMHPWPDTYHSPVSEEVAVELNLLLQLLKENKFERPFSGFANGVRLRDFAEWCVRINKPNLPQELTALAKDAPQAAPTAVDQTQTEARVVAIDVEPRKMKRAALIAMLEAEGFDKVADKFRRSYPNDHGLHDAAKHKDHNYWYVDKARDWFIQEQGEPKLANKPDDVRKKKGLDDYWPRT